MSKVLLTCELNNLNVVDGVPFCSRWEFIQPVINIVELEPFQLAALMSATTVFLAICYGGRGLLKLLFTSASSD